MSYDDNDGHKKKQRTTLVNHEKNALAAHNNKGRRSLAFADHLPDTCQLANLFKSFMGVERFVTDESTDAHKFPVVATLSPSPMIQQLLAARPDTGWNSTGDIILFADPDAILAGQNQQLHNQRSIISTAEARIKELFNQALQVAWTESGQRAEFNGSVVRIRYVFSSILYLHLIPTRPPKPTHAHPRTKSSTVTYAHPSPRSPTHAYPSPRSTTVTHSHAYPSPLSTTVTHSHPRPSTLTHAHNSHAHPRLHSPSHTNAYSYACPPTQPVTHSTIRRSTNCANAESSK